jgi:hypothetical protein
MIFPPPDKMGRWAKERVISQCFASQSQRENLARMINSWRYTGSDTGSSAIFNRILPHCDKLASAVFSPVDARFLVEYDQDYGPDALNRAQIAGRYLTREITQRNLDMSFQEAVEEAVPHGCTILKSVWTHTGMDARVIMPWQFGVYQENETDLDRQEAMFERTYITPEELWRRISHRSDARELFKRAVAYARRQSDDIAQPGFMQQILMGGSSPLIQDAGAAAQPGGLISLTGSPGVTILSPEVAEGLICAYQGWVVNDETGDYTTIQLIDPDILIAPRMIRSNLFIPHEHPYTVVRINPQQDYFWGQSEISQLIKMQALLRDRFEDVKKIMSLQYDRIRAFIGFSGMNDEKYDQLMNEGWLAEEQPGGKIEDLTPKLPDNWAADIKLIEESFDQVAGFDNVLSGKGEEGIRSGNHFAGAVRQASPRLRDRALRAERQYAGFGEKNLWLNAAKDARAHWTKSGDLAGNSDFLLAQLPDDTRVLVDSHSSSPVYEQDHANTAAFLFKAGAIDGEDLLDLLPIPNRDVLKEKLKKREISKQQLLKSLPPELLAKELGGGGGGAHHGHH